MYIRVNGSSIDLMEVLPIFFGVLIGICIIVLIAAVVVKNMDNGKTLVSKRVTVLEKPMQQGSVAWYVMECDTGERLKLRSFQGNTLLIAVGDHGIVNYKGQTIVSFTRQA